MLCCVVLLYIVFMTSPPRETGVNIGLLFVQTRQTVPDDNDVNNRPSLFDRYT